MVNGSSGEKNKMTKKLCLHLSDTHEEDLYSIVSQTNKKYDLVFITGDLTYKGTLNSLTDVREQMDAILAENLAGDIVWIPGNHDLSLEDGHIAHELALEIFIDPLGNPINPNIHLLIHEAKEVQGVKIFGSPWTPWFFDWAFNYDNPRLNVTGRKTGKEIWKDVPENTQVLLTHGPPFGILDRVKRNREQVGCPDLLKRIGELKSLKFCLFGHIHEGYGSEMVGEVTCLNSSIMDERYRNINLPQEFYVLDM